MPTFQYKARTRAGELVTGALTAADRRLAVAELGRMGYFPLHVESGGAKSSSINSLAQLRTRVSSRDVLTFTQQLSSLLRSGMSLSQALGVLERRSQKKNLQEIFSTLRNDIVQGETLSGALGKHPRIFSRFYVNLVKAGEASGSLDEVLTRLTKTLQDRGETREKVLSALAYPLILVVAGLIAIVFLMMYVVPRFVMMFKEMSATLPLPTRILIGVSNGMLSYWWVLVVLIAVAVAIYRQRARTPEGRLALDGWKLRVPVFGQIVMAGALGQFARTLSTLLENGVPVLNALQIVEDTMTNRVIANEIREARTRVTDGTTISTPLAKGKIFPPLLIDMLAVGEESGEVVPALKNIADTYEQDLARSLKVFTTLLEPAIIIFMALIIASIALSILLAVFDLTSGIGK